MSYKTILVNLNETHRVGPLLDSALIIARKYQAHIIGLHVIPPFNMSVMSDPFGVTPEIVNEYLGARKVQADEVEAAFRSGTEKEGVSCEWRCVDALSNWSERHLIKHARCADLIISDQGAVEGGFSEQTKMTEQLIVASGRPVLVIPNSGSLASIGDFPLVAWNGSQQASRAVFNAMPFLKSAKEVKVIWVDPNEPDEELDLAGSEIGTTLARHDIKVEVAAVNSDHASDGETLIEQVREYASDLLVMGAYGHSQFQEYFLGGATRSVLKLMTVPVLFSH
ncbi:MAG: universal stress protein [Methyloligellaceae bacterium]